MRVCETIIRSINETDAFFSGQTFAPTGSGDSKKKFNLNDKLMFIFFLNVGDGVYAALLI